MDFPKSVPGVGLVNNQFVDEDPVNGTLGSLIPAKWGNDVTKEILGVLEEGDIAPDENNPQQLRAAVAAIVDKVAPVATKAEAETNDEAAANNVKRMTPLRVLQAIKARLVVAGEAVIGMLRIGTQAEVDAGLLSDVAVTPLSLAKHRSIGVGQSWTDVTASRAKNTTYTNSTGRPIALFIVFDPDGSTGTALSFSIDSISISFADSSSEFISIIVPPGSTYKLGGWGVTTPIKWLELRA